MRGGDAAAASSAARRLIVWLAAIFLLGAPAFGAPGGSDEQYGFNGKIGPYPVAMVVTVRDRTAIVAARYSYASRKRPIALTAAATGPAVTMREPGGAAFDLHLVGPAASDGKPLTFYTSVGLVGVWADGVRRLPVKLSLVTAGAAVEDCVLYPDPPPSSGVDFPNRGCEHTPDKAALDGCIARRFTSDQAVSRCLDVAARPCRDDQMDQNLCAGNLDAYLDRMIGRRLRASAAPLTAPVYRRWSLAAEAGCKRRSAFSPDGSGYGAGIALCLAGERLRLLQNGLRIAAAPPRG